MDFVKNMDLMKSFLIERFKIIPMNRTDYNSFLQKEIFRMGRELLRICIIALTQIIYTEFYRYLRLRLPRFAHNDNSDCMIATHTRSSCLQ
jgi:hypothetical protein